MTAQTHRPARPGVVTARDLLDRYGLDSTTLWRWRERGWIRSLEPTHQGGAWGADYPAWCERVVALLCVTRANPGGGNQTVNDRWRDTLSLAAGVIEQDPATPFVLIDLEHVDARPATAAEVVAAHEAAPAGVVTVVVSPPVLESVP